MPMLVFLNRVVIFLIFDLWYVNVVEIFCLFLQFVYSRFFMYLPVCFWSRFCGKLLFLVIVFIVSHFFSESNGREYILEM